MSLHRYDNISGYSGQSYDRNVFEANLSTVNKLQRDFWNAKQVLRKKLGKQDEQCVVASDSEIDAKLDLFHSIQRTCADLIKLVEKYQLCICALSRDENAMGRFLKDQGSVDKTPAGKMMGAVGKAQCFNSQQRLNMRNSLGRLHHDIETFRYRAISDCLLTVNQMEESRTHYRASLRWMQDISSNLDPEQYKKLEKFRKVQTEVRLNKEKFDRLKWAVCQKVDLLCASRTNLFSTTLVPYQTELTKFWEKSSHTLAAVLENMKDYQHFEFKLLKDLNPLQDAEEDLDENKTEKLNSNDVDNVGGHDNDDQLINLAADDATKKEKMEQAFAEIDLMADSENDGAVGDGGNALGQQLASGNRQQSADDDIDLLNDILGPDDDDNNGASEFEKQWQSVFGDFEKAEFSAPQPESVVPERDGNAENPMAELTSEHSTRSQNVTAGYLPSQLLDLMSMQDQSQPATMQQQHASTAGAFPPSHHQQAASSFPHQLSGYHPPSYTSMFGSTAPPMGEFQRAASQAPSAPHSSANKQAKGNRGDAGGRSAWFSLFAELDPLQNPDALGKMRDDEKSEAKPGEGAC